MQYFTSYADPGNKMREQVIGIPLGSFGRDWDENDLKNSVFGLGFVGDFLRLQGN
jgi:hypothetical protein